LVNDEPADERAGFEGAIPQETTREVQIPHEKGTGECWHAVGGCGGHLVKTVEATAEELVTERGLRPCRAAGCKDAGLDDYQRCNGCGKPVFERIGGYCEECAAYLEANPAEAGHEQYELREEV